MAHLNKLMKHKVVDGKPHGFEHFLTQFGQVDKKNLQILELENQNQSVLGLLGN